MAPSLPNLVQTASPIPLVPQPSLQQPQPLQQFQPAPLQQQFQQQQFQPAPPQQPQPQFQPAPPTQPSFQQQYQQQQQYQGPTGCCPPSGPAQNCCPQDPVYASPLPPSYSQTQQACYAAPVQPSGQMYGYNQWQQTPVNAHQQHMVPQQQQRPPQPTSTFEHGMMGLR